MKSLVSVIVTTRNNEETIDACLESIRNQSYKDTELIVVDNNSTDQTKEIAKKYTKHVFTKGPERSAQRNFAVSKAKGKYVLIIDSDMVLTKDVVRSCVDTIKKEPEYRAIIIPEESFGVGFWAQCKRLERSFYVGQDAIEAARFFDKAVYVQVGGYNEAMTGGEDWDLSRRVRKVATIGRSQEYIRHNEGHLYFMRTIKKMYYYGSHATVYFDNNSDQSAVADQSGPLARYKLFFSHPKDLLLHPILSTGMLTLKTSEYAAGGIAYYKAKRSKKT